jgi:hypothetical protein
MTDGVRSEEIEVEGHNRVGSPIKVKASVYPLTSVLVVEATPIGVIILLEETSPEP